MIRYLVTIVSLLLMLSCQQNKDSCASKRLGAIRQDTIWVEASIHDTIDYYFNKRFYVKIKEELIGNKQYSLNLRMNNCTLDSIFIRKMQSSNIVLDNYHIHTIGPHEDKLLNLHFYARAPRFSKELTIGLKTGADRKALIVLRGDGRKAD